MPVTATLSTTASVGGVTVNNVESVSAAVAAVLNPAALATAKTGQLTVRTNNNTGTLTMDSGHGLATGDRLDVFWIDPDGVTQKCQYKVTAGTVSGNSVPIGSGVGDNLPALVAGVYNVTVQKAVAIDFPLTNTDLLLLAVGGGAGGKVVLEKADGTVVFNATLQPTGRGMAWSNSSGLTNPVTDLVGKAFVTNANSQVTNSVTVLAGLTG